MTSMKSPWQPLRTAPQVSTPEILIAYHSASQILYRNAWYSERDQCWKTPVHGTPISEVIKSRPVYWMPLERLSENTALVFGGESVKSAVRKAPAKKLPARRVDEDDLSSLD